MKPGGILTGPKAGLLRAEAARELVDDPVLFTEGLLRTRLWSGQKRLMYAAQRHRRVAVKACHASGKTFALACLVLWFLTKYPQGKVVTTAPTGTQVKDLLWGEIKAAMVRSLIDFPEANATDLHLEPENFAIGRSTNQGVRFQGFHAPQIMIIVDESPGIIQDIWGGIDGVMAGGEVTLVEAGNPVVPGGHFYDNFSLHAPLWNLQTISCFDTPNFRGLCVVGDEREHGAPILYGDVNGRDLRRDAEHIDLDANPWPTLVTRRWVLEKILKEGTEAADVQSRCFGLFPQQASGSLLSLMWIERAEMWPLEDDPTHSLTAALDVAESDEGTESVLTLRCGMTGLKAWTWTKHDVVGDVIKELRPYRDRLTCLAVDAIGVGAGTANALQAAGYPVVRVKTSHAPRDPERFVNERDERWWTFREMLEAGECGLPEDAQTRAQLLSVQYFITRKGQIKIESKKQAAERGVASIDRADSWMMNFTTRGPGRAPQGAGPRVNRVVRGAIRRNSVWTNL